jgi:antibiotic biosynthesis monooxygenase (ABM) superfamily enzyme
MASAQSGSDFSQVIEFVVTPGQQRKFVAAVTEHLERFTCTYPGFISASVHLSTDGLRVLNQVVWQNRRASEEALLNADAGGRAFLALLRKYHVQSASFNAYEVSRTINPRS